MNEQIENLLPFYALGAVSDDERSAVEAYLAENPIAAQRLAELRVVANELPLLADPVRPKASSKRFVLDRIAAEKQATRQVSKSTARRALRWPSFWRRPLFAFAVVLLLLLPVWNILLQFRIRDLNRELAIVQAQAATQQQTLALLTSDAVFTVELASTIIERPASGRLLIDPDVNRAILLVADLNPLPADATYQFWLIEGETPFSAGLLSVNSNGTGTLSVSDNPSLRTFDAIGVSIEPAGGSPQPTGEIVLLGTQSVGG